jgi:hypothetical protein
MGVATEHKPLNAVLFQRFDDIFCVVRVFEIPVAVFVKPSANSMRKFFRMQVCVYVNQLSILLSHLRNV